MGKESIERRIDRILKEEETFFLSLIILANMNEDDKYKELSQLMFLFDNYEGFKQFIKFYEGRIIHVPTVIELKQALRLLNLFQYVKLDKKDFDESYNELKLSNIGLSKDYCLAEINKFSEYIYKNGTITMNQIKKLSKK